MKTRLISTALLLACLALPSAAMARMYKWTDEEGNINYGAYPPEGVEFVPIAPPPPAATPAEEAQKQLDKARRSLETPPPPAADIEREKQKQELYRRNCEAARQNLRIYQRHSRILRDGETVVLDDKERMRLIREAEEQVKKYCQQP